MKRKFVIKTLGTKGVSGDWISQTLWEDDFKPAIKKALGMDWEDFKVEQFDFGYELVRADGKLKETFYISELDEDNDIIRTRKPTGLREIKGPTFK